MLSVSDRTEHLGTENAFVVLAEVNKLIEKSRDIVNFCIGQPDFDTPKNIKDAAIKAIMTGKTGYTASAGILPLREAIVKYISDTRKIKIVPDSVVVANGAKPFIMYTIATVTDYGRGDEVLYPNPGFPIYESQITAQGATPIALPLLEEKGFNFDIDDLEEKVNDKTRLLILNSPQNPTGGVISQKELKKIADIVLSYDNLWVLSDEVYSRMIYDRDFQSISSIDGMKERTVIIDGVSKTYSMTGWRLGFAINEKLAPYFARWVTNTTSCAAHPTQYATIEALTGPQKTAKKMVQILKDRRNFIVKCLNDITGINCLIPGGAIYVWPNVTEICNILRIKNSEELRKALLHEAGVAVLADIHFGGAEGDNQYLRLSYALSKEKINEGIKRIRDHTTRRKN